MDIEQLAGTRLGNYEIERLLGRIGMGVVFNARQVFFDSSVAPKIFPPTLSSIVSFKIERHLRSRQDSIIKLPIPSPLGFC